MERIDSVSPANLLDDINKHLDDKSKFRGEKALEVITKVLRPHLQKSYDKGIACAVRVQQYANKQLQENIDNSL